MPSTGYLIAGVAVAGVITLALRALPFAALKPLRKSKFVQALGQWMPAGILIILAIVVFRDQITAAPGRVFPVLIATAVTVLVHLVTKRRALISIAAGTACYVLLLNLL
ncbi:branched-subunit amino acid transport protein AzlD [Leucobacter exalbidus]|uniref:Branched-subunit amino acid transport protein AzlD n=1 Tax=Leucobacter exalbidus TaxID=662960 RepID=A0A940T278_9MICO|nr:branched-subunit amino acid transport protein AzlD [Leucobacter exalbidus]